MPRLRAKSKWEWDQPLHYPAGSLPFSLSNSGGECSQAHINDTSCHTQDRASTMDTISNNPGTGRTVGLLISVLGRKVERGLGKAAVRLSRSRREEDVDVNDSSGSDTIADSSFMTLSNNPGAGRTIGLAFSFVGRNIERCLGNLADRAGFGPVAVYLDLERINESLRLYNMDKVSFQPSMRRHTSSLCKKLLAYTQSARSIYIHSLRLSYPLFLALQQKIRDIKLYICF